MRYSLAHVAIKVVPIYTCFQCGSNKQGTTITMTMETTELSDVASAINQMPLRVHDMPLGWCFNDHFFCGRCTHEHFSPKQEAVAWHEKITKADEITIDLQLPEGFFQMEEKI